MAQAHRRLAAIVAIDVAGYSRLMGADEQGTLERLKELRAATEPIGKSLGGRVVGTAGDGVLWEFPSVVDAVTAAIKVQALMAECNANTPDDKKMLCRIGINLGDVLVDGSEIYGDGVNVAARLEGLAESGGICVSRTVRDNVRDRMDIDFEDMGEIDVKNIARPVHVFKVLPNGQVTQGRQQSSYFHRSLFAATVAVLLLVIAGSVWWWSRQPSIEPADLEKFAFALPDNPSIAVLPFDNRSGDPEQDYLADGFTESITVVLSRVPSLFVIARNSSFTYKGKPTRVQTIAQQLGVRYLLEGSVQRSGNRLRITAQLVDAITGKHLWAEKYDRNTQDIFSIQDDIAQNIFLAVQVKLTMGDDARVYRKSVKAFDTYLLLAKANSYFQKQGLENHRQADAMVRQAIELEPDSSGTNVWKGYILRQRVRLGLSTDSKKDLGLARKHADAALSIDPENGSAFNLLATLDMYDQRCGKAIDNADRALEYSAMRGTDVGIAGWVKFACGRPREAIALLRRAQRLDPFHFDWIKTVLAFSHLHEDELGEAKSILLSLVSRGTDGPLTHRTILLGLAAISVFLDDLGTAREYIRRVLNLEPNFNIATLQRTEYFIKNRAWVERYYDALRKAGLPEKPKPARPG